MSSWCSSRWRFHRRGSTKKALFDAGIPATALITKDIVADVQRLKPLGVKFRGEPKTMGPTIAGMFEDRCGNLINLVQPLV